MPRLSRIETLILIALTTKERYGLDIVQRVRDITDGRLVLPLGTLYTTLHRMERKGFARGRWGEATEVRRGARRRYYQITALGERALAEARQVLESALGFIPANA